MNKIKSFFVLGVFLILQSASLYADQNKTENFFEDFDPQDIFVVSGGSLVIRSGATLLIENGATFTNNAGQTIGGTDSTTKFVVEQNDGSDVFVVDTTNADVFIKDGSATNVIAVDSSATTVTVTTTTDNLKGFVVEQSDGSDVLEVNTTTPRVKVNNNAGTAVFDVDADTTAVSVVTTTNSTAGFAVKNSASTAALTVNTVTNSVSILGDLTLGGQSGAPIIDVGSGTTLQIFNPADAASANTLEIQGDVSISGDLFNPAVFEIQSGLMKVENTVNTVNNKMKVLTALEKQVERVNKEVTVIKDVANFKPETLDFARRVTERNLGGKDIGLLVSGRESKADNLHTHENFPKDVMFQKDVFVKGERAYVRQSKDNKEMISFAQESPRAMVSDVGMSQLENGEAFIELDPQFLYLVSSNENAPLYIQLTPAGDCNGLYVNMKTETGFVVRELKRGTSNTPFYWRVEVVKRGLEGLKYISPEDYKEIKAQRSE